MTELIKITENKSGERIVSAKELYNTLGFDISQWSRWYKKNIEENDFAIYGQDWIELDIESSLNRSKDFGLSIDFAKRISMMAKTEMGETCRNYFIACEKKLQQIVPRTHLEVLQSEMALLIESERVKNELIIANTKIESDKPKVVFAESVIGSSNSILVRQFAKDLCDEGFEIGQNRLFEWFRDKKYLNVDNEPYQQYVAQGLFEVITRTIGSGSETFTSKTTKITGCGQVYFANKIKNQ